MASPRLLLTSSLVSTAALLAPSIASASPIAPTVGAVVQNLPAATTASDPLCANEALSQPFSRWADHADYAAAPGGSFEVGTPGWRSIGKVSSVRDNEPWKVTGNSADRAAVSLATGSSISSPSFCGGVDHPTVRLFAKSGNALLPGTALITIRYTGAGDHLLAALPLGVIKTGQSWQPTDITATLSGLKLLTGTHLGITVTALTGSVMVDDVFVDPYRRS